MSSVRMCDKCKDIFSENDAGWQTFTANTIDYDEENRQITVAIRQDLCAGCAIETPKRANAKLSETEQRIRALEAQNAKLDELNAKIEEVGKVPAA